MAKKVKFTSRCKHGTHDFAEGTVVEFTVNKTGAYFIALGAAEDADPSSTPDMVLGTSDISVDPNTVWATGPDRGKRVV